LAGGTNLYSGSGFRSRKMLSMSAMPSKQSKSYLQNFSAYGSSRFMRGAHPYRLAGISIFSWGGSCFPSTMGRSEFVVYWLSACVLNSSNLCQRSVRPRQVQYLFAELAHVPHDCPMGDLPNSKHSSSNSSVV
jgi:hypothetical protein